MRTVVAEGGPGAGVADAGRLSLIDETGGESARRMLTVALRAELGAYISVEMGLASGS